MSPFRNPMSFVSFVSLGPRRLRAAVVAVTLVALTGLTILPPLVYGAGLDSDTSVGSPGMAQLPFEAHDDSDASHGLTGCWNDGHDDSCMSCAHCAAVISTGISALNYVHSSRFTSPDPPLTDASPLSLFRPPASTEI